MPSQRKTTRPIMPVPVIAFSTERLLMRPYSPEDLDDFFILRTQPEVMKWTYSGKIDAGRELTREWMSRGLPPKNATTFCFAIEEKAHPGVVVGAIGSARVEPPEFGFMFRKEMWGKGYATETLKGFLDTYWALPRKDIVLDVSSSSSEGVVAAPAAETDAIIEEDPEVLFGITDLDNGASRHVLLKCGFQFVRGFEDEKGPAMEYTYSRPASSSVSGVQ